jgi:hypothetical protein
VLKAKRLKHRYLVFEVSHSVLLVDASSVGAPNEILPAEGKAQTLPRFFSGRGSGLRGI